MAITINQQPYFPTAANSDLLYVITSNSSSSPQYQFVCDIQNQSGTVLSRLKMQPNPSGYGLFDVGQIIEDYLSYDPMWKSAGFYPATESMKQFKVAFGEELGTSTSSSITMYNGSNVAGAPAKSGSILYMFNGVVNPNDGDWNFNTSSYFSGTQRALTNMPHTQSIRVGEYATIGAFNGHFATGSSSYNDLYKISVYIRNGNTPLYNGEFGNTTSVNCGPRSFAQFTVGALYNSVSGSTTTPMRYLNFGYGPGNLSQFTSNPTWDNFSVIGWTLDPEAETLTTQSIFDYRFERDTECTAYDGVRFIWLNEYGTWDYYTFTKADSKNTQVSRTSYTQPYVPYSTTEGAARYNISRRGATTYNTQYDDTMTVQSDWLTQEFADWVRELLESPEVYVQEGTNILPVVIQNSSVDWKRNPASQKMFTYNITYKYANQRRAR